MTYIVVCKRDLKEFQVEVNEKIQEGYEPVGGICVIQDKYEAFDNTQYDVDYYQAMILKPSLVVKL